MRCPICNKKLKNLTMHNLAHARKGELDVTVIRRGGDIIRAKYVFSLPSHK